MRCNGCQYRKNLKEFLVAISNSRVRRLMRLTTKPLLLKTVLGESVDHDSNKCYQAEIKKKTILSANGHFWGLGRREQEHFWAYQHDQKNYYHLPGSYPEPVPFEQARSRHLRAAGGINYFDRYLGHKKDTFLFITTIPRSSFLSQDDLLYEGSTIKTMLETLRQKYHNLKECVDQLLKNKQTLTDDFNVTPMAGKGRRGRAGEGLRRFGQEKSFVPVRPVLRF